MNIIFLDIDGVMNMYGVSARTFRKPYGQHIEPHLVSRLNYICENVKNLGIVISSSWRSNMEDLQKQLEEQGFKYWNLVIGKTPNAFSGKYNEETKTYKVELQYRGEQIQEWFNQNPDLTISKYLVIDDEVSDICGEMSNLIPKENVLETDGDEGLLNSQAVYIVKYFKEGK